MMDLAMRDRDIYVRLRDDVWALEEPGTLCLSPKQALMLRMHLNELTRTWPSDGEPEDG
jgi:hypothetical protein